jgi:hypothetical protein
MNLSGIISISGKPGLFKVVAQGKNNIIVESLIDQKRSPAYSTDRISSLEDISIYTTDEDAPLKDILVAIYEKENGKSCPSHKDDLKVLTNYLKEILPNYDDERVYPSDIKKIFQWYNLLLSSGNLQPSTEETDKDESGMKPEEKKEAKKKASSENKTSVKATSKSVKPTGSDTSKISKSSAPKKTATTKTGSSRGK